MKVLLIHGYHAPVGGADKIYLNTGELLNKLGHKIIYFSFKNKVYKSSLNEKYFLEEPSKFRVFINLFYNKQAAKKIELLICEEKPDIAHLHAFWGGLTPSILIILRKYNIPIIHSVHDYNLICPVTTSKDNKGNICEACKGKYFYKGTLKRCFKGSFTKSLILSTSLFFRRKFYNPLELIDGWIFTSWFTYHKHLQYMPNLINSDAINLYNFNPNLPFKNINKSARNYFLYLGRLSNEKGLITLIMAFSRLREWWENNPMSIIESNAAGIPVIGANVGGIPEIIIDGKTGYLFEMKNVDNLTKVITKANSLSADEYNTMSNNAIEFALKFFNKEQYINSLLEYYEKHIEKKKL